MTARLEVQATRNRILATRARRLPLALLGAYVALLPFQFTIELSEDNLMRIGPSDLVLLALVVLAGGQIRAARPAWTMWHSMLLLLMPISAVLVSVLVEPVSLAILFAKVVGIVSLSLLYLAITSFVTTWEEANRLLSVLTRIVVIQNVVFTALYIAQVDAPLINDGGARLSGMVPDPNAYGSLLIITFALLLATSTSGRPLLGRRATQVAVVTLPLSIALTSGSRTAWVAFAVVVLLFALARPGVSLKYMLVVAVGMTLVAMFLAPELAEEQIALGTRNTGGRFELADAMFDAFWSSPLFGVGIGQFFQQHGLIIHNTAGWFLGEFGIVGLTIIGGLILTFARRAFVLYQRSPEPAKSTALGLALAFAGMCVVSLGIEALYQRWWWVVMAVMGAMYSQLPRRKQRSATKPSRSMSG